MQYSKFIFTGLLFIGLLLACKPQTTDQQTTESPEDLEAREDSLELVAAYNSQAKIEYAVEPALETHAVAASAEEDAADDPAFWLHPSQVEKSIVYGSNKQGGIVAYNLKGEELAYYPVGKINNIDVLNGFSTPEGTIDIIGGSNRSDQSIDLFKINPETGALEDISANAFQVDTTELDDVYGFCFYKNSKTGDAYAIVNAKNGRVRQFQMNLREDGKIDLEFARDIVIASQVEGMVADDERGILYIGEEGRGIWKLPADPNSKKKQQLIPMSGEDNPEIVYDVEGLSLYLQDTSGYLIASSQGNFSYAIFERNGDNKYLGSFKISAKGDIDGVEETDGIQAVNVKIDSIFPNGLFIVQDGFNFNGEEMVAQNFKLVDWSLIQAIIDQW